MAVQERGDQENYPSVFLNNLELYSMLFDILNIEGAEVLAEHAGAQAVPMRF
jgi:hypothetical protein